MKFLAAIALIAVAGLLFIFLRSPPKDTTPTAIDADWAAYSAKFVKPDGRVVDADNNNVSHSESQGFGMVLAEAYDDRAAFDRMFNWAEAHLRRPDGLYSWRYIANAAEPVADKNNATDGELLISWALLRAAKRWNEPRYRDRALQLADLVRVNLLLDDPSPQRLLMKPGADGFFNADKTVVNLSYWVFPALIDIGRETGHEAWARLVETGLALVRESGFGKWRLPPDWLDLHSTPKPADGFPPRFSFDAVRVPLYMAWAQLGTADAFQPFATFWSQANDAGLPPAWVDLVDESQAPYAVSQGVAAIRALALARAAERPIAHLDLGALKSDEGYYSASLFLLAKLAVREAAKAP
jgi:endoglucanase